VKQFSVRLFSNHPFTPEKRELAAMRKDALPLLGCLLIASGAFAKDDLQEDLGFAYGGEETISIATGYEQPVSTAPAVATVITDEEIRRGGARFLSEVLEWVPGVHSSLSSIRFSPIISIRGIYTNTNPQVLVLINGVPLNQLFQGDRGINNDLPVEFIKRVEVVRGPGSAVYGADAFAGVINVVTKTGKDLNGGEGGVRVGSFETLDGWINYGKSLKKFDFAFSLQYHSNETDDDRIIEQDAQTIFDDAINIPNGLPPASLAPGPVDVDQERIDTRFNLQSEHWKVNWYSRHHQQGGGPGLAQALDPTAEARSDDYLLDAAYSHDPSKNWNLTYRGYYYRVDVESDQTLFPPGALLPMDDRGNIYSGPPPSFALVQFPDGMIGNPGFDEEQANLEAVGIFGGLKDNTLRFALGVKWQMIEGNESKNFGPGSSIDPPTQPLDISTSADVVPVYGENLFIEDESRRIIYASIQDEVALASNWDLTVGGRWDRYSDFGNTFNPRIAAVWRTSPRITTKFLYGRGFRAPSFQELYNKNNPVAIGNPDLEPEIINTVEAAVSFDLTPKLNVGLDVYYFKIDDAIEFVEGGSGAVAQNVGKFKGPGTDFKASYEVTNRLGIGGFLSWQDIENDETGEPIANTPRVMGLLQIDYDFLRRWQLDAKAKYIGDRVRSEGDPRDQIDDYTLVDLTVRRAALEKGLELGFGVKNLFDEDAFEPSPYAEGVPGGALIPGDYPLNSRYLFGELLYKF
jgi:outer membrane receptor protein involved in Fe transport